MEKDNLYKNGMERNHVVSVKGIKEGLSKVIGGLDYNKEWILESK